MEGTKLYFKCSLSKQEAVLGGAAIVARHISASGAKVEFTTVVGKDLLGRETIKKLKKEKIKLMQYLMKIDQQLKMRLSQTIIDY